MWKLNEALPKGAQFASEIIGSWPEPSRPVGLEFEFENVRMPGELFLANLGYQCYWEDHEEGSLQNGREFVTRPERVGVIEPILAEFLDRAKAEGFEASWRAGLHVHVQTSDLNSDELFRLLLLYSLFEPSLYSWVGIERSKTRFCKPWWQSYQHLGNLVRALGQENKPKSLKEIDNSMRYSALNAAALWKYGTLEFRHMGATFDLNRIMTWLHIIMGLYHAAKFEHWKLGKLLDFYDGVGHGPVAQTVFGKEYAKLLPIITPNPGRETVMMLRTWCEPISEKQREVVNLGWEDLHKRVAGKSEYVELFEQRRKGTKKQLKRLKEAS